jgi:hypothetical protein
VTKWRDIPGADRVSEPEPGRCVGPTRFMDCDHPSIIARVRKLEVTDLPPAQRAVRLFEFVRDRITYEFKAKLDAKDYIASTVLARGFGFCVQKAVLLCALARAAGVPAALAMTDVRDRSLPKKITDGMGTDILHHHGLAGFHLGGRWLTVDASLSPDVVHRKRYRPVEFDGRRDALLQRTTRTGRPHCEYIACHGLFEDLPFEEMMGAFREKYRGGDPEILGMVGLRPPGGFEDGQDP